MERENLERDRWNWGPLAVHCGNLVLWKLPGIYEGDPNEDSQEWGIWSLNKPFMLPGKASSSRLVLHSVELLAKGSLWKSLNNPGC